MTRKDKKREEEIQEENKNTQEEKNHSETKIDAAITNSSQESKEEKEQIKLLECGDQKVLEYFSKDDLCKKVKEFEKKCATQLEKIEWLTKESNNWKNKYMRLQAEFENAQKRWDKNRQNLRLEYTALVIKSFLPLYDSFKKALSDENSDTKILKGFFDQFMNILKSYKAEPIQTNIKDQFDYNYHEALSSIEKSDLPNNTIIDIVQDGWKFDKDVIRYTKVILSKEPKPPEPEPSKIESNMEEKTELGEDNAKVGSKVEETEKKDNKTSKTSTPETDYID
jgi:molecular chaperone GrpE